MELVWLQIHMHADTIKENFSGSNLRVINPVSFNLNEYSLTP
jgi:hypothetical protein